MVAEIKTFEPVYAGLKRLNYSDGEISLILGIPPYFPQRYLGPKKVGLPIPVIVGIFRHLTFQGEPILLNYPSEQAMLKDKILFEQACADINSKRDVGWLEGKSNFTIELGEQNDP